MNKHERTALIRKLLGSYVGGLTTIFPLIEVRSVADELISAQNYWDMLEATKRMLAEHERAVEEAEPDAN